MTLFVVLVTVFGLLCYNQAHAQGSSVSMLEIGTITQCDGKDASNYTYIVQYTMDSSCSPTSIQGHSTEYLISTSSNGQKTVNTLQLLTSSVYSAGAYAQYEGLYLAASGNLAGKFIYVKEIRLIESYIKKCSSILGLSYISSQSLVVLIVDKLDLTIFLAPNGAYEPFKKSASTTCQGSAYHL